MVTEKRIHKNYLKNQVGKERGQDGQKMTLGQDNQARTAGTGQPERIILAKTGRPGQQQEQDSWDRTASRG
jgi:hypothetical protein